MFECCSTPSQDFINLWQKHEDATTKEKDVVIFDMKFPVSVTHYRQVLPACSVTPIMALGQIITAWHTLTAAVVTLPS